MNFSFEKEAHERLKCGYKTRNKTGIFKPPYNFIFII